MTREEVISVTGPIADRFLVEIVALQPLPGELVEAAYRVRGDEVPRPEPAPATPRVARISAILEAADAAARDPVELEESD
ncbi:hypothetical protein ACMGDH_14125 [Sphingomonas sp. DT-207]|uniref:hypothetical protein n=1 Tax=Sphingomonas sp. DT-207 TaxID=3396167 RepID=UPI003F1D915F